MTMKQVVIGAQVPDCTFPAIALKEILRIAETRRHALVASLALNVALALTIIF